MKSDAIQSFENLTSEIGAMEQAKAFKLGLTFEDRQRLEMRARTARAEMLAKLGYVAFAADMYGEGKSTTHPMDAREMAGKVRDWSARRGHDDGNTRSFESKS